MIEFQNKHVWYYLRNMTTQMFMNMLVFQEHKLMHIKKNRCKTKKITWNFTFGMDVGIVRTARKSAPADANQ